MAWGPFKSQAEVDAERRVRLQQGKIALKEYLKHAQAAGGRYREMAKKALALGEKRQAGEYITMVLQYENQGRRWQAFQLKLSDIELRGSALKAMGDLVGGLDGLVKSIHKGLSLPVLEKTMIELQTGMMKADQVEAQMTSHLENMSVTVGPDSLATPAAEVPEELRGEVERLSKTLMEELSVEASKSPAPTTLPKSAPENAALSGLEARMAEQIERLGRLRPENRRK